MSKSFNALRGMGFAVTLLYLAGWIVALVGLGLGQKWCRDHVQLFGLLDEPFNYTLLAHMPGDKCRKLYRLPWFIWVLSTLPVLLSLVHLVKPSLVRRGAAALFAALAVLQVLAANTFLDLTESPIAAQFSDASKGNKVRVAGFATMAATSLLMIVLESFMGERAAPHHGRMRGGRADAPVATEGEVKV